MDFHRQYQGVEQITDVLYLSQMFTVLAYSLANCQAVDSLSNFLPTFTAYHKETEKHKRRQSFLPAKQGKANNNTAKSQTSTLKSNTRQLRLFPAL